MPDQSDVVAHLEALVMSTLPQATMRAIYGGQVIELVKETPKSRIGGIFAYADHVSLEFSEGRFLHDPANVLEGTGKARRHVKLHCTADIIDKNCAQLLLAAAARKAGH